MRYYQFLPLALCTFLWVDCRHIRELTSRQPSKRWVQLLASPIRLIAVIGAKFFGIMTIGWFLFGLQELGLWLTALTIFVAFAAAEFLNWPLARLVTK